MTRLAGAFCLILLFSAPHSARANDKDMVEGATILFLSDYGLNDDSVAVCKGAMLREAPNARIIDITHNVRKHSILDGTRLLFNTSMYFPPGTVFVVVIEPGVGGKYKSIVVKTKQGQIFVLPDNGIISMVADRDGLEVAREITNKKWISNVPQNFISHGRDIFCPVAARLARGEKFEEVGPIVTNPKRINIPAVQETDHSLIGIILGVDGSFGNITTNVTGLDFDKLNYQPGDRVRLKIGEKNIYPIFANNFNEVPKGTPLIFVNATGGISFAINHGNFGEKYGIQAPMKMELFHRSKAAVTEPLGASDRAPASN
jgi:S-adenosyl-L-methionine hydrolase (adenosine-forming)